MYPENARGELVEPRHLMISYTSGQVADMLKVLLALIIDPAVQQGPGHYKLVDFRGAAADAGVAQHVIPVGNGHICGFPNAAEYLHDFVDTPPTPFSGTVFNH